MDQHESTRHMSNITHGSCSSHMVRVGGFQQMAGAGFVKLRMISAEMALRCIFTERGLTAPRRIASRRGLSYYPRYETQTYSLTAIGLRLEQQVVVGRCILFFQGPARVPSSSVGRCLHVKALPDGVAVVVDGPNGWGGLPGTPKPQARCGAPTRFRVRPLPMVRAPFPTRRR